MKELVQVSNNNNLFVINNGEINSVTVSNGTSCARQYAILSTEWISAIGEEIGLQQLSDTILYKLAEDASYRLREVLHKCVIRLKHSKRKRLTSSDVNTVLTNLCDVDPLFGISDQLPTYHSEANLFVPRENFSDLSQKANEPPNFTQVNFPFLQELETFNSKLMDARNIYAKKVLKMLFNSSQKTFQIFLHDCSTNPNLEGQGVVDKLMSIARSMVISNNAQYTRLSIRTCQLIIAITNNELAVYPDHINSVDKLTELLLELLLGQGFINSNLETLFKDCVLKLMLRWPSVANRFIPMLKNILLKKGDKVYEVKGTKIAFELLIGIEPLIFFNKPQDPFYLVNFLKYAVSGSSIWHKIALTISAITKSGKYLLDDEVMQHFGDSILPYLSTDILSQGNMCKPKLPIIVRSKIRYVIIKSNVNKNCNDKASIFSDSTLKNLRREIRFAFAGSHPVPPSNLRRVSLRANYQILRNESQAPHALIASHRLLIFKHKKKRLSHGYNLCMPLF